jgi:hypothetical protein
VYRQKISALRKASSERMKVLNAAVAILSWIATGNNLVRADGELIASWVQFTGADMQRPECANLVQNPSSINRQDLQAPGCFFTAEVRAIYNDTAMANPGCPSDALKIDGEETPMMIRVNAVEYFENFVSERNVGFNTNHSAYISL